MANKRDRPEEIVTKLQQVEVLVGQGMARIDAIRQVCIVEQTDYRWRKQYGGMGAAQLKELKRWTCPVKVPDTYLIYTATVSNARGLFPPSVECLRRGL